MCRLVRNSPHQRNLIKPEPWCVQLEVRVGTEGVGLQSKVKVHSLALTQVIKNTVSLQRCHLRGVG